MNNKLNEFKTEHKIILGNFHCVIDNNLEIISGKPHTMEDVEQLKLFVFDNCFTDNLHLFS